MAGLESPNSTLILVIWRHLLNLSELKKTEGARLVVVGPSNLVVDEKQIDVIHHVEGPITPRDQNHTVLMQKVRELCAGLSPSTTTTLCVFERCLQREIAQIREEFDIEGPLPDQFDQLTRRKDIRAVCRRGGLTTLRCCSFGSVQGKPEAWVECANSQVGQYPMFLRPVNAEVNCMHTLCIAHNAEDLKSWIRARPQSSNYCVDYLVEECLENGYEFIAIVSSKTGLIGAFSTIDKKRTLYMSVKSQAAYGIEYLNAEQTRDILPGVESFVMQSMKTVFNRSINSLVFVKGFYRGHNTITFMGGSLELRKRSLATLFREANNNKPWEVFAVETQFGAEPLSYTTIGSHSISAAVRPKHYALINFPNSEGFLLHQTKIAKRKSEMRVAWRVSEGEELLDSDGIDENFLQIFLSNASRTDLLVDVKELINNIDIAIDRLCIEKRGNMCHRVMATGNTNNNSLRVSNSGNQLVRSCTTVD